MARHALLRRAVVCLVPSAAIALCPMPSAAFDLDPFGTTRSLPPQVEDRMLGRSDVCRLGALGDPLTLPEAIERALCNNPKTREAWAQVRVQAASIGIAKSAYLPVLSGTAQETRDHSSTHVLPQRELDTSQSGYQQSAYATLNWLLFDFGGRRATLDNATALLVAAEANQQNVLQMTFVAVAKDYYAAQAAHGALDAAQDIEATAAQSFKAAHERVARGVAPISDELQAQSSAAQAVFNRVRAQGDWQTALGTLAVDMAIEPYTPLGVPDLDAGTADLREFNENVATLIADAKRMHPTILAAQAQLDASDAKVRQTRAAGMPSVALVGRESRNSQRISPGFGAVPVPSIGRDSYIGVELTIPFFEGFQRTYQVRQAESQSDAQRAVLSETEQKVGLDVWSSYQGLTTTIKNLGNSAALLDIAQRSYAAARVRYESGVGTILELLTAQSTLATAKRQRIQSLSDWRTARLQLAGALGRLSNWSDQFER